MTTPTRRAAFVTIGQTPRVDLVPEMKGWIGDDIDIVEYGVLDALSRREITALYPTEKERCLVTRLRDGSEAVVRAGWVQDRLQTLLHELGSDDFFSVVLLCTGHFSGLQAPGLLLEAQTILDHSVAAIARGAGTVGVMVPMAQQIAEFHFRPRRHQRLIMSHASPYRPDRLEAAAGEMAAADVIVMHCIGYTEAMRRAVAEVSGRPVLLARRAVAGAVCQLL